MSKVDAQRAMRDARYAAYEARRKAEGDPVTPGVAPAATATPTAAPTAEGLCGHRSIGQKSCIRPAGHEEESHRYK